MTPNQNFTLTVTNSASPTPAVVQVPLFSGPGLDPVQFPSSYDSDTVNFSHCNGPVQIANNQLPPTTPYFLGPVFGGTIVDNSAKYQAATDALPGGTRDTLDHWKGANGFNTNGTPAPGEASALYFNNGDLKFGRDMHCRVTNNTPGAIACYVSNFGNVGTDDAPSALKFRPRPTRLRNKPRRYRARPLPWNTTPRPAGARCSSGPIRAMAAISPSRHWTTRDLRLFRISVSPVIRARIRARRARK